jgi:hypothetical protein
MEMVLMLGRPNIKMDLQEDECAGIDWIELAQDRGRWGHLRMR